MPWVTGWRTVQRWKRPKGRVDSRYLWWYYRTRRGFWTLIACPRRGVSVSLIESDGLVTFLPPLSVKKPRRKKVKKRNAPASASEARHLAAVETNFLAKFPALIAHCAVTKYDDGDPRKPGWITVKTLGSAWQVEAKDPDACLSLRVVQASIDDALVLLNMLLEAEEAPWEVDQWLQQQAAKNRKKG